MSSGDLYAAISGHSYIGGRKLSMQERILDAVFAAIGFAGAAKAVKGVFLKKMTPKGVGNSVKTLGRGSTGRTTAKNLAEQLAMKEVKSNPLKGAIRLKKIKMNDKRWPGSKGWIKMQRVIRKKGKNIVVHFVYNTKTKKFDDFKFK